MKSTPITQKAKCNVCESDSPNKANMALIYGAADIGASKSYVDPGKAMGPGLKKAMDKYGEESLGLDLTKVDKTDDGTGTEEDQVDTNKK
jgi:hypothetical protein